MKKPVVGITMGDPAGVGPEIVIKSLSRKEVYDQCSPLAVGDAKIFDRAAKLLGGTVQIHPVHRVEDCLFEYGTIDVFDLGILDDIPFETGKESAACGDAAFQAVTSVISLAMQKKIDAPPLFRPYRNLCRADRNPALHNAAGTRKPAGCARIHPCIPAGSVRQMQKRACIRGDPSR